MTTKEVIVRPEDFEITQKRSNTVQAVVEKISFYGNYQLLEVAAKEKHFLVTSSNYKQPGAIVHLKIKF
ncbi:MAG TPA: hypothetical protein DGG95_04280 [Cytophagales bacterium]|nr:hypothetical protein [Cytophagales bacterium]